MVPHKPSAGILGLSLVVLVGISPAQSTNPGARLAPRFAPDKLLVKFKPGTAASAISEAHRRAGARELKTISGIGVQVIEVPAGKVLASVAAYEANPNVLYAEPDFYRVLVVPSEEPGPTPAGQTDYFFEQWYLHNTGQSHTRVEQTILGPLLSITQGTEDADVDAPILDSVLHTAVDESFHCLNIDGCSSTNDSVFLLASGASDSVVSEQALAGLVSEVCRDLAYQLAADAEGASRVVTINVTGAVDNDVARHAGRAVADSDLVRTSFYGGDPNWGRIVGALGAAGVDYEPGHVSVRYAGVTVAAGGTAADFDETSLLDRLTTGDFIVDLSIGEGPGSAAVLTTDLTPEYVTFNSERS